MIAEPVSEGAAAELEPWEWQRSLAVLRAVSRRTQQPVADILGKDRSSEPVQARRLAVFGLRHHVGLSWLMIGRIVGQRPETALSTVRWLENRARVRPEQREQLSSLLDELRA